MVCVDDRPNCGGERHTVPDVLEKWWAWLLGVFAIVGGAIATAQFFAFLGALGTGAAAILGGAVLGIATAILIGIVLTGYADDRCNQSTDEPECVAGVVIDVVESFSSNWDEVAPWSAKHDRLDLVIKSTYWQVVEAGDAYVFCTDETIESRRRSEIARCYFYDPRVCAAAQGAAVGGSVGAMVGAIAGAVIAGVMCVTVILCALGLALAVLATIAGGWLGGVIGGQVGKAGSTDEDPTADDGETLSIGHLISVVGPWQRRDNDDGARVMYWADNASLHGTSISPQPYSYCEINDELAQDACNVNVVE
jgi:hypothetical protein